MLDVLAQATEIPGFSWMEVVKNIGVPGAMMLAVLYALLKGWIVIGWYYTKQGTESDFRINELRKEKDMWRDMAIQHLNMTERAVNVAESAKGTTKGP